MFFFSFRVFRYDENYSSDISILDNRIRNLFNLIDSCFIPDLSVSFFFNTDRFSSKSNIRSIINRCLMCSLLEYYLPLFSFSAYGYSLSLSSGHTTDAGVVGFVLSCEGLRIGLDIEHVDRTIPIKVAAYASNNSDHLYYSDKLLSYWVLKESIFKSRFHLNSLRDINLCPLMNGNNFSYSVCNDGNITLATALKIDDHLIGFSIGDF